MSTAARPTPAWVPWLAACRPRTLPAALVPVAVGTAAAAAEGPVRADVAALATAGALLLQIAANLANDVFDFEKGADGADRLGPTRTVAAGLLAPAAVKRALLGVIVAAVVVGALLAWRTGPLVVALGLASLAAAVLYTAGPFPLAYHGLGDAFVLIFFGGVAVAGSAWVQLGRVPAAAWWATLPVGALATAILVVNNLRDRHSDARAGKHTLAVRLGRRAMIGEYAALLALAYGVPVLLALGVAEAPRPWVLAPVVTLPLALRRLAQVASRDGADLNPLLGATAQLLLLHGALFAAGLVLPWPG